MKWISVLLLLTSCGSIKKQEYYNVRNIDDISWVDSYPIIRDSLDKHPTSPYWNCEANYLILQK